MPPTLVAQIQDAIITVPVTFRDFSGCEKSGDILVHNLVADTVRDFFTRAFELRFPIHSVIPVQEEPFLGDDNSSCEANNSSGFNYRTITVGSAISKHSIGCAFDINPRQNPYIRFESGKPVFTVPKNTSYDPQMPGTLSADHPLVKTMKNKGWTWGGDWKPESGRVDYQHFEIVPEELKNYLK